MRSIEHSPRYESLDTAVLSVAQTYGFTGSPLSLTRNDLAGAPADADRDTALIACLVGKIGKVTQTTQAWATAKKGGGTTVVYAAASPKLAIAQAFVVKAALSTVEAAGFDAPSISMTSVGDQESRRRYMRELGNFFKKNAKDLPDALVAESAKDPDGAARALIDAEHPLAESLPRTIDYLSESSRKIMLETIALFESLGIGYELDARLPYVPEVQRELVFAVFGTDRKGNRVRVASGGRYQDEAKGVKKKDQTDIVGMSVVLDDQLDVRRGSEAAPSCFVVHIGEAAKMRAFTLLDSLWRAQIALHQALLLDTIAEQMEHAKSSGAKYIAVIGQREALDGTVILKNTATQLQETVPAERFVSRMSRVRV
ncbi:MAG: His/Gly/Thr/Pro-type tRNA ligase C-terminal domain-containing protein [Candidatus Paceibacteria bacterium]